MYFFITHLTNCNVIFTHKLGKVHIFVIFAMHKGSQICTVTLQQGSSLPDCCMDV